MNNDLRLAFASQPRTQPSTSLEITRILPASRGRVWRAWTDPAILRDWMGPDGITHCDTLEMDLRAGGAFRLRMHDREGGTHTVHGTYLAVDEPEYLSFTWAWEGDPSEPSHVSVRIALSERGTRMTLTHINLAGGGARDRHLHGWTGSFERMDRALACAA